MKTINPNGWPRPSGYSNAIKVPAGRSLVFISGQVGWDSEQRLARDFAGQFEQALRNVLEVLAAAGGKPQEIARMTVYVTGAKEYAAARQKIGETFRALMRGHYPAMTLVEVAALFETGAKVEIECTAAVEG